MNPNKTSSTFNELTAYFDVTHSEHHLWKEYAHTTDYDILTGNICIYSAERATQIADGVAKKIYTARHSPLKDNYDPLDNLEEPLIDSVNRHWDPEHNSELWARIIPNKYPVLSFEQKGFTPGTQDLFIARPFDRTFADFTIEETLASLTLIAKHCVRLMKNNKEICEIDIFQNYGDTSEKSRESSGETQPHPHMQIWGFPFITPRQSRQIAVREFWMHQIKNKKQNIFDIALEMARERNTVVYENESFLVYAPPAPRTNYTIRLIPTNTEENKEIFGHPNTSPEYLAQLTLAFHTAMKTIKYALNDPGYNIAMHTISTDTTAATPRIEPTYNKPTTPTDQSTNRFFVDIHPRIDSVKSGMEHLTDLDVIGVRPEITAQTLRSTLQ